MQNFSMKELSIASLNYTRKSLFALIGILVEEQIRISW